MIETIPSSDLVSHVLITSDCLQKQREKASRLFLFVFAGEKKRSFFRTRSEGRQPVAGFLDEDEPSRLVSPERSPVTGNQSDELSRF
ncbi:MAG TPA: hypothetical protein VLE96_06895 [Chlamydiales bacterium]|nr:hypothetical protein [Chlamydiales bacterium]